MGPGTGCTSARPTARITPGTSVPSPTAPAASGAAALNGTSPSPRRSPTPGMASTLPTTPSTTATGRRSSARSPVDTVVGTVRRPDSVTDLLQKYPDTFRRELLDVTDAAAVRDVVDRSFGSLGRIDVVVSNAGYGLYGAAEELSDEQLPGDARPRQRPRPPATPPGWPPPSSRARTSSPPRCASSSDRMPQDHRRGSQRPHCRLRSTGRPGGLDRLPAR
jgi:hypothetical protein